MACCRTYGGIVFGFYGNQTSADDPSGLVQDLLLPEDDEIQRKPNAARAQKVWKWCCRTDTAAELLVASMVLRPCMSFMGFLFKSESVAQMHSATVLIRHDNPAARAMRCLLPMLLDLQNTFLLLPCMMMRQWCDGANHADAVF